MPRSSRSRPVSPWLGFVVFPEHRLVEAKKVQQATRRPHGRLEEYHAGRLGFAKLEASVLGWIMSPDVV